MAVAVLFVYLLPLLNPPLITTPDSDFGARAVHRAPSTSLVALGLNVVVGYAGLLDLGYVGFFAVGAYTVAVLGSPSTANLAVAWSPSRSRSSPRWSPASSWARRRCGCAATTWRS